MENIFCIAPLLDYCGDSWKAHQDALKDTIRRHPSYILPILSICGTHRHHHQRRPSPNTDTLSSISIGKHTWAGGATQALSRIREKDTAQATGF